MLAHTQNEVDNNVGARLRSYGYDPLSKPRERASVVTTTSPHLSLLKSNTHEDLCAIDHIGAERGALLLCADLRSHLEQARVNRRVEWTTRRQDQLGSD